MYREENYPSREIKQLCRHHLCLQGPPLCSRPACASLRQVVPQDRPGDVRILDFMAVLGTEAHVASLCDYVHDGSSNNGSSEFDRKRRQLRSVPATRDLESACLPATEGDRALGCQGSFHQKCAEWNWEGGWQMSTCE